MSNPDARAQFDQGIERAVQHWLSYWRARANDPQAWASAMGHALRALRWSIEVGRALEAAIDLALAMQPPMMYQGQWSEWEALLRELLGKAQSKASQERRFELRHCLGTIYMRQHRLDESLALSEENYRWALAADDHVARAAAAIMMAEAYLNAGAFERALVCADEVRMLGQQAGVPRYEADGLIDAARALIGLGELAEAERRLRAALELSIAASLPVLQAKAELFSGHVCCHRSRWSEAAGHYQRALCLVISYGDEVGRATVQIGMARALTELGQLDEAARLLEDAVRVHRRHGNHPAERVAVQRLHDVMARQMLTKVDE